jgi:hypothetical protein
MQINTPTFYEDNTSLKQYLRKHTKEFPSILQLRQLLNQAGTGNEVELENKSGETIADIGKTAVTVLLDGDADNAATNGLTYTLVYKTVTGVQKTAVGTGTATLNGTPVAFVPAVADLYESVSFTASAAQGDVEVYAKVAGGITVATITKTETTSSEAQLAGVGSLYAGEKTDQAADLGKKLYIEYINHLGEIKYGTATLDAVASNTVVLVYQSDSAFTSNGKTVKDFYRRRSITSEVNVADEMLFGNINLSALYAVIAPTYHESKHSRYFVPTGKRAIISDLFITNVVATAIVTYFKITYTKPNESIASTERVYIAQNAVTNIHPMLELEEKTELKIELKGNLGEISVDMKILEFEYDNS